MVKHLTSSAHAPDSRSCDKMGQSDIDKLNQIYTICNQTANLLDLQFQFKEDSGNYETAIGITEDGHMERPLIDSTWKAYKNNKKLFCPDILDYSNKIIIEYDETPGQPRRGAKLARKGHDPDGMDLRTSTRDLYYALAKFRVLKIFDYEFHDSRWKIKLVQFLIKCFLNPQEKT
jgi:hypothetical protein